MQYTDRIIYKVTESDNDKEIIRILENNLGISSGMIRVLKYNDGILLNGLNTRAKTKVKEGDIITLLLNCSNKEFNISPVDIPIQILYEDDALIIVNKSHNMVSHPVKGHFTDSLLNALSFKLLHSEKKYGLHLVSRLDKDTSGIVIVAKNPYIQEKLKLQSDIGLFKKVYIGITKGSPQNDSGFIDMPISRKEGSIMERIIDKDGAHAITAYRVIERINEYSILEFEPKTGRTHQIRVHCLYSGFSLIGDSLYGSESCHLIERQALHAQSVSFMHPVTGTYVKYKAILPQDMQDAIKLIKGCKPLNP